MTGESLSTTVDVSEELLVEDLERCTGVAVRAVGQVQKAKAASHWVVPSHALTRRLVYETRETQYDSFWRPEADSGGKSELVRKIHPNPAARVGFCGPFTVGPTVDLCNSHLVGGGNSSGQCAVCTLGAGSGQPIEAETGYVDWDKRGVTGAHGVVRCRKQQLAVC